MFRATVGARVVPRLYGDIFRVLHRMLKDCVKGVEGLCFQMRFWILRSCEQFMKDV